MKEEILSIVTHALMGVEVEKETVDLIVNQCNELFEKLNVGGITFMRYLITTKEVKSPFLTEFFEPENHFNQDVEMIVYDLLECTFTTDGKTWHDIEIDHL